MLAESEDEWAAALDAQRPRFAVIYEDSFNYLSKMCLTRMREAAFRMIPAAKARGCYVIVSGSDATDQQAYTSPPAPTPSCWARARRPWPSCWTA